MAGADFHQPTRFHRNDALPTKLRFSRNLKLVGRSFTAFPALRAATKNYPTKPNFPQPQTTNL